MSHSMQRRHYADYFRADHGRPRAPRRHRPDRRSREGSQTVYGDECKFGGGKVLREGMGQAAGVGDKDALDVVITNALIIDYTGIYKPTSASSTAASRASAKRGIRIVMAGVTPGMVVGVTTEAIAGEGLISHRRRNRYAHSLHLSATSF